MPHVHLQVLKGTVSAAEKERLLVELTEAVLRTLGPSIRPLVQVTIEELPSGDWSIGGRALTVQDVQDLRAGRVSAS